MAQIPDHILDRIRDSVDIVEVISRYLTLRKMGKNYKSLCPFHTEKTPSFTVNSDKQIYYCFGCGAGGNVFNFLMRYEKITFLEAVKKLAGETGIEVPKSREDEPKNSEYEELSHANQFAADFYYQNLEKYRSHLQGYFQHRHISADTIVFFKLGYVPDAWDSLTQEIIRKKRTFDPFIRLGLILESEKDRQKKYDRFRNRLMFPIHNLSGRIIAFGGRTLSSDPDAPKYVNSPESSVYNKSQVLYGLYYSKEWIRQEGFVIVVEGYMDFLQLYQNDIKNVVATSGTALTEDHAKIIRRYTTSVVLCYDADNAGIQAAIRGGQILFQENLDTRVLILPEKEDPDSYVKKSGKSAFFSLLNSARDYFEFRIERLQSFSGTEEVARKAKTVQELVESLAAHPDPIKQNLYINILAQRFQLQEGMLIEEISRKSKLLKSRGKRNLSPAPTEPPIESAPIPQRGAWNAEKDILIILLNYFGEVRSAVFEMVEDEDFLNEEFREIFRLIRESGENKEKDLMHWIFSTISNQKIVGMLSAEFLKDIEKPGRYLNDCILKLKEARHQNNIDLLRQKLRKTDSTDPQFQLILTEINFHLSKIQQFRKIFSGIDSPQ